MTQKILDHIERAKNNLMSQYKEGAQRNSINLRKLSEVFVNQIQELENVFYDLYTLRYLDTAFGVQLDRLGDIVGIKRNNLDDNNYRKRIYSQININASYGQPEALISALKTIMKAKNIKYSESYVGEITIEFTSYESDEYLIKQIQNLCLAGIKNIYLIQNISPNTFYLAESTSKDFQLITTKTQNKDNLIVDSDELEYNLYVTSGDTSYIDPFLSLGEVYEEDGETKYFIAGILTENFN